MSEHHGGSENEDQGTPPRWDPLGRAAREQRRVQAQRLIRAFESVGVPVGAAPDEDDEAEVAYFYAREVVLTRDADAPRVRQALGLGQEDEDKSRLVADRGVPTRRRALPPGSVDGLTRVALPSGADALEALERLDRVLGVGVATPDHVLHVAGHAGACPATEPVPADGPLDPPPSAMTDLGRGVRVVVVDTGLLADVVAASPWMAGTTGDAEQPSVEHYRGHGTFIAGIVRAMAPSAEVDVEALLWVDGALLESDLAPALGRALESVPDVISMSAGTTTRQGQPLLSLQLFWERRLRHLKGTVLVCAAGNDGDRGPFYPAAFPWTVSVGALEKDGSKAPYSNHGSWVDVWARGSDVVNGYPTGDYTYAWPPHQPGETASFTNGLASWCGTSFSTPLVAGLVAARASWSGESARVAARSLVRAARHHATPYVGAVLEPGIADQP